LGLRGFVQTKAVDFWRERGACKRGSFGGEGELWGREIFLEVVAVKSFP